MLQIDNDQQWIYTFIRTDIPLAQQLVQVGHSCFEAGRHAKGTKIPNLVLCQISDKTELEKILDVHFEHCRLYPFYEPDNDLGLTSITTQPVGLEDRKHFKRYKLWKPDAIKLEQVTGIEPVSSRWQRDIIPLYYTCQKRI